MGIENTEAQTSMLDYGVPPGAMANPSPVSPELEMSGRMTPAQLAQLEQTFEAYADPSVLADAMPAPNYGPAYGGGGGSHADGPASAPVATGVVVFEWN